MKSGTLTDSFRFAWAGILACVKRERNMKIHLSAALAVIGAGWFFGISRTEWLVCLVLFALVMGAEMMNTAIEAVVDLVSPSPHPLAKLAKDTAAGAVLLCAIFAAVAGFIIFGPRVWALFVK